MCTISKSLTHANLCGLYLFAHNKHLSLSKHLCIVLKDSHFILVLWTKLIKDIFFKSVEESWIKRIHAIEKCSQTIIVGLFGLNIGLRSNLLEMVECVVHRRLILHC